jgi:hypothetical protein
VATPWPERLGDRSDFNDTLRTDGLAAVRARITAALDPGPAPPKRLPVEEGRRALDDGMRGFFDAMAAYDAANDPAALAPTDEPPPASEDDDAAGIDAAAAPSEDLNPLPVHLVQIDMGGGKSRRARAGIAQRLVDMRSRGDTRNIAIAVPTHTLGAEQAQLFEELPAVRAAGLRVAIWRGRERDNPDAPGEAMCRNLDLVRDVQALKLDVKKNACAICPHREGCAYLDQNNQRADLWLVAHQMLFQRKPAALGKLAAVVVDESPLMASLEGVERHISLPLDALERVDLIEDASLATDRLEDVQKRALQLKAAGLDETSANHQAMQEYRRQQGDLALGKAFNTTEYQKARLAQGDQTLKLRSDMMQLAHTDREKALVQRGEASDLARAQAAMNLSRKDPFSPPSLSLEDAMTQVQGQHSQPTSGGAKTGAYLPLPRSAAEAVVGQTYNTGRGPARWDGSRFLPVGP